MAYRRHTCVVGTVNYQFQSKNANMHLFHVNIRKHGKYILLKDIHSLTAEKHLNVNAILIGTFRNKIDQKSISLGELGSPKAQFCSLVQL